MITFLGYLLLIFVISAIGGLFPLVRGWSKNNIRLIVSFGVGVLFGSCFFYMLPEITQPLGRSVGIPILIGFFIIYILEKFVMVYFCEEYVCEVRAKGIAVF